MKINLLPEQYRPQKQVRVGNLIILFTAVIVIITVSGMAVIEYLKYQKCQQEAKQIKIQLQSYQKALIEVAETESFRAQIEKRKQEINLITDLYQPHKSILKTIAAMAPDDLWLTELQIKKNGGVTIVGQAIVFSLIGDFLKNLNGLESFTSSRLKEINTAKQDELGMFKFRIELETGRSFPEYAEK